MRYKFDHVPTKLGGGCIFDVGKGHPGGVQSDVLTKITTQDFQSLFKTICVLTPNGLRELVTLPTKNEVGNGTSSPKKGSGTEKGENE